MAYKPTYTWPNPAFPFRVYYESESLRIFIIENIQHNWEWLSKYHRKFRENDYFFVYCGWYHSQYFAKEAEEIFDVLSLRRDRFFFMYNDAFEQRNFSEKGFWGEIINQNSWLDENLVMNIIPGIKKIYDAIYVGRFSPFKRHELASEVNNLALVAGTNHSKVDNDKIPESTFINDVPLSAEEVCAKINESYCGLILSSEEGACFASSEYLLCGVPVVSTQSKGGRDVWYNDYNAILCEDDAKSVARAVEELVCEPRDPHEIRNSHISLARYYRSKFITVLASIFHKHKEYNVDARQYFDENFIHKLRRSYKPNFEEIFK